MSGLLLVMFVLAFLPALLPLSQGRIGATIGVSALCICAAFALPFLVFPGVILWFIALFIGMWAFSDAKQDRKHVEMMRNLAPRADHRSAGSDNSFYKPYIKKHKPAFSYKLVWDVNVNGEQHRFYNEHEAESFVASRLPTQGAPAQIAAPGRSFEIYNGIRYVLCSDHSVTAYTPAGTEAFPSVFAFRTWADSAPGAVST